MGKLILFLYFLHNYALCISPYIVDDNLETIIKEQELYRGLKLDSLVGLRHEELFSEIREDKLGNVDDRFSIDNFYNSSVNFWFHIYSLHDRNTIVLHDKEDLSIVYETINFTELKNSNINSITQALIQNSMGLKRIKKYKIAFMTLAKGSCLTKICNRILDVLKKSNISLPTDIKKREIFFTERSFNIRIQTGQKDAIERGLLNYKRFELLFRNYINIFELPQEVLSTPFLESSFNTKAKSKVGASGPWQFMKFIGKKFMVINNERDDRLNPILSTISALHLMKQNFKILRQWDLAITAYNSGTKHLIRARKKFKSITFPLERYITEYDSDHIGFASKNFYASFLALTYTLANKTRLFPHLNLMPDERPIYVYIAKKSFHRKDFFKMQFEHKTLNNHLLLNKIYPVGTVVISSEDLNSQNYKKITPKALIRHYPKNYHQLL
ncbi:MAG: lytic transglycosylase domain-containing protein [Halobacteriovoraceae bacterium]|nr:lytic transglycosylase domain-containing protein [Halobacteriovoraceae bacterium]